MGRRRYINVEVDLEDFDSEVLRDELLNRKEAVPGDVGDLIEAMWRAFYTGNDRRAMELAREVAESGTGRLVPAPLRRVA